MNTQKEKNGKTSFVFQVSTEKIPESTMRKLFKQKAAPLEFTVVLALHSDSLGLTMDLYRGDAETDGASSSSSTSGQVLVASVKKGGAAARAGLSVGNLLSHVNGEAVSHPSKAVDVIAAGRKKQQTQFKFTVVDTLSAAQMKARNRAVKRAEKVVKKSGYDNQGKTNVAAPASRGKPLAKTKAKPTAAKASKSVAAPAPPAVRAPPPPMPTRPPTPYLLYVAERRPQIQAARPNLPFTKLRKIAGDMCKSEWESLSKARAKKYEDKAAELKRAFELDLVAFFANEQNQSEANPYGVVHLSRKVKKGEVPTGEFLASFKRKVRKARRSRKDPDMPKRPHSAYIIFVNEVRLALSLGLAKARRLLSAGDFSLVLF